MEFKKLYTIEGMDGVGKATQTKMLLDDPPSSLKNDTIIPLSFPDYDIKTARPLKAWLNGQLILRDHPMYDESKYDGLLAVCELFGINRLESLLRLSAQHDLSNMVAIADRYTESNMLYQGSMIYDEYSSYEIDNPDFGRFINDTILKLGDDIRYIEYTILGIPAPTAVFYLDLSVDSALSNIADRNNTTGAVMANDINENRKRLTSVKAVSDLLIDKYNWIRIKCNDDDGNMLCKEVIHEALKMAIDDFEKGCVNNE